MNTELSPEEVIVEFQRRRSSALLLLRAVAATHFGGWIAAFVIGNVGQEDPWYRWVAILFVFGMIVGSFLYFPKVFAQWRCPACEHGVKLLQRMSWVLDPSTCPHCGSQLKR